MENLTEPITRGWMEYAHTDKKAENWAQPKTVKSAPAYIVRQHVGIGSREPSPANDLYPGWYIGGGNTNSRNTSATIDRVSGKTATSCTPAAAREYVGNANAASWNIDIWNGGKANIGSNGTSTSSGSAATDDVHNCNDSPPTVTLTAPPNCNQSCTITATVSQGTHPLSDPQRTEFPGTITFTLNGETIHSTRVNDSPSTVSFTYTPTSNGGGTLTATVTDSVLYSGTASTGMNFTAKQSLSSFSATLNGSIVHFSWSGGRGLYGVTRSDNGFSLCTTGGTSCDASSAPGFAPAGTPVTLKDADGTILTTTVQ